MATYEDPTTTNTATFTDVTSFTIPADWPSGIYVVQAFLSNAFTKATPGEPAPLYVRVTLNGSDVTLQNFSNHENTEIDPFRPDGGALMVLLGLAPTDVVRLQWGLSPDTVALGGITAVITSVNPGMGAALTIFGPYVL